MLPARQVACVKAAASALRVLAACLALAGGRVAAEVAVVEDFDGPVALGTLVAPGVWTPDRRAPAGFEGGQVLGGDARLKVTIAAEDADAATFYQTQGRALVLPPVTRKVGIDLHVPAGWGATGRRMAGFWGVGRDGAGDVASYPIVEFTSSEGVPRFRAWEPVAGGWVDLGLPSGFAYDTWVPLGIELVPDGTDYDVRVTVGDLAMVFDGGATVTLGSVILQGHNTAPPGVAYTIFWDDLSWVPGDFLYLGGVVQEWFVQPGDVVTVPLSVANLTSPVVALQAFLAFSSAYFGAGPGDVVVAPGGGVWSELIHAAWVSGGDLDVSVGVQLTHPGGTQADATTSTVALTSNGTEGETWVVFRAPPLVDPGLIGTTLLARTDGTPVFPHLMDSGRIVVDGTAPSLAWVSVLQAGQPVRVGDVGAVAAVVGTVNLRVSAADLVGAGISGLAGPPVVTVTPFGGGPVVATLVGEESPGVYHFTWEVTASTPSGVASVTVEVEDRSGNAASLAGEIDVNVRAVSGQVGFPTLRTTPSSTYSVTRSVTFVVTNGSGGVLDTRVVPVVFTNVPAAGEARGAYVLERLPAGAAAVSAKDAWTLRRRQVVILGPTGQAILDFLGTQALRGGDLNGNNVVNAADFNLLKVAFLTTTASADVNGDGVVNAFDFALQKATYLTAGDLP